MDKRLRILQIFNRYLQYGGEEGSVYRIGDALQSIHDVEYFLTSTDSWLTRKQGNKISLVIDSFLNLEIRNLLQKYQKIGQFDVWQIHNVLPVMSPLVYREAFRRRIPVVHYLHNYRTFCTNGFFLNHGEPCMRCAKGNFMPAIQTGCWQDSKPRSGLMGAILLEMRAFGLFKNTTAWISLSQRQKDIHAMWGIPEDRIAVIPHFLDPDSDPLPKATGKSLLFLGRLSAEKGVAQLIHAWSLLNPNSNHKLYIAGDGPEKIALESLTQNLNAKNIIFTGFVNRAQQIDLWKECLASIVPSIWEEPFGMVVLEAWSKGRAVIANRIGALPELIEHGWDGLLSDANSPESLAQAMDQILGAEVGPHQMGLRGFRKLQTQYSRQNWIRKTADLYRNIANELSL